MLDLLTLSHTAVHMTFAALRKDTPHASIMAVDATTGNGHDALFLAQAVGEQGQVYAFDVQEQALTNTAKRLATHGLSHRLISHLAGHEHMASLLPAQSKGGVAVVMFNLGYLPGSDKTITTCATSTLQALAAAQEYLHPSGLILVHSYAGHATGAQEAPQIHDWCARLPWDVWQVHCYAALNRTRNLEQLFLISRNLHSVYSGRGAVYG